MKIQGRAVHLAASVWLGLLAFPLAALGASITAEEFVANVQPTVRFVADAGRLAVVKSSSGGVRAFARSEIGIQTAAANALVAWRASEIRSETKAAASPTIDRLAPLTKAIGLSFDVVTAGNEGLGSPFASIVSANEVRTAYGSELSRLAAADNAQFDELYVSSQRDALLRLSNAYRDFILNGDDVTLRRIAVDNLPKVRRIRP